MTPEEEQITDKTHKQEHCADGSVPISPISNGTDVLRCPKCCSARIREYYMPMLLTFLAFPCLLLIALVVLAIGEALGTDWLLIVLFTLILAMIFLPSVFLVASSFALVGKHRCKECGYRFRIRDKNAQVEPKVRFPVLYSVLSALILFVVFVVWHLTIMHVSGGIYKPTDWRIIRALIA